MSVLPTCEAFAPEALPHGAEILETQAVPAEGSLPAACVVRGRIVSSPASTIHFKIDLVDRAQWNRKLLMVGGVGFDGFIVTEERQWAVGYLRAHADSAANYAVVSSDSGHQGRPPVPLFDFSSAVDATVLRNHAYEANHLVIEVAAEAVRQFYGDAPKYKYMIGNSNGGRSGLASAQRYPDDYDGIIALEPALSQAGFAANLLPEMLRIFSSPDNWLSPEKVKLYEDAELRACDGLDGLEDGLVGNVAACDYVPDDLACEEGSDPSTCLTQGQIETIRRIYSAKTVPVTFADGIVGYPASGRGGPTVNWPTYIFGSSFEAPEARNLFLVDQIVRFGVMKDPELDLMSHDPAAHEERYRAFSEEMDTTNPDLARFAEKGGKLLLWFGLADGNVSYERAVQYHASVEQRLGAPATRAFTRFWTSPSLGHEIQGPGADSIPFLDALDAWVEKGEAPDAMVAAKVEEGASSPKFTRPLCEYPTFPRYKGEPADPNVAESFDCSAP